MKVIIRQMIHKVNTIQLLIYCFIHSSVYLSAALLHTSLHHNTLLHPHLLLKSCYLLVFFVYFKIIYRDLWVLFKSCSPRLPILRPSVFSTSIIVGTPARQKLTGRAGNNVGSRENVLPKRNNDPSLFTWNAILTLHIKVRWKYFPAQLHKLANAIIGEGI